MNIKNKIKAWFSPAKERDVSMPQWLPPYPGWSQGDFLVSDSTSMKVAAVNACVEIRSDSIGKMPFFIMNGKTHEKVDDHYMNYLLKVRPNKQMSPFVFKKLIETWRLMHGNAYVFIVRNGETGRPEELLPLNPSLVNIYQFEDGEINYVFSAKDKKYWLNSDDVIHLKAFTDDGIIGQSVLSRARETIETAGQQIRFEGNYYSNNASPSGVVTVDTQIGSEAKQKFREEWERVYGGAANAFKVAVLDHGMTYKPISMSPRDSQFVESKEISVADIARFFLVPLYKLQAGKQTYNSNEQNSIEYVVTALSPTVTQYEEEFTYKTLFEHEHENGLEVRINMNAELRGDTSSRASWYRAMTAIGVYSPNDVRALEDMPNVEGGDLRIAPLNSIPLEQMGRYFDVLMEAKAVREIGRKEDRDED